MHTPRFFSAAHVACIAVSLALGVVGCKNKVQATDDASLNTQVQSRLSSDPGLSGIAIQASVVNGVATLNGTVSSEAARSAASGDAAQVPGVHTVVDNLVVQAQAPPPPTFAAGEPLPPPPMKGKVIAKPSAAMPRHTEPQASPIVRYEPAPQPMPQQNPSPAPVAQVQQPEAPPPPPAPVVHKITLPAGTSIPVRITQTLDSATTLQGDRFTGVIASDIIVDGLVVLAQGTPVTGHVDEVKEAAHYKGSSLLSISLTSISHKGERIDVATEPYNKEGEGRGKNTAEKVGGGAAVGAILGGILGGGKGAAIGAAAGGGVGAGANTVTRGEQVQIPSESVVRFRLSDGIIVRVVAGGNSSENNSGPTLEHRNQ